MIRGLLLACSTLMAQSQPNQLKPSPQVFGKPKLKLVLCLKLAKRIEPGTGTDILKFGDAFSNEHRSNKISHSRTHRDK